MPSLPGCGPSRHYGSGAGKEILKSSGRAPTQRGAAAACRPFSLWPTSTIARIAGISSCPNRVSAYSTEGGEVGITVRMTMPFCSNSRRRVLRTLAEIVGISVRSSMNRLGPALRYQITLGVQAPARRAMHSVSGHAGMGGGALFLRTFSGIPDLQLPGGYLKEMVTIRYWVSIGYLKLLALSRSNRDQDMDQ